MEKIKNIIKLIDEKIYHLNNGKTKVKITQEEFLQEYENGLLFIDYLTDFYFVQRIYNDLTGQKSEKNFIISPTIRKNRQEYYHTLLFFNFLVTELKKCLNEINDRRIEFNCRYYEEEGHIFLRFHDYDIFREIYLNLKLSDKQSITNYYGRLITLIKENSDANINLFLLCILMNMLLYKKMDVKEDGDLDLILDFLTKELPNIFEIIQNVLSVDYTNVSSFKFINDDVSRWLEELINNNNIVSKLETLSRKEKNKLNCLAIATVGEEKYFSINGLDGKVYNRIREVISEFLEDYHAVVIPDEVRYYLDDEIKYITYKQFKEKGVDKKENRMFTCCERKLFAQMRIENRLNNNVKIIVTSQPCEYCSREINFIQENYNKVLNVIYPREEYVSRHDQIARGIWKEKMNDNAYLSF